MFASDEERYLDLMREQDRLKKRYDELFKINQKLANAYLRIRYILQAWDTPIAPTAEQIHEVTEEKAKALVVELKKLKGKKV